MNGVNKLIAGGVDRVSGYATMDLNITADFVNDVRLRWPFSDESIEIIFASHLIEHLTRDEALFAMYEAYRILKPGGIIRLSTPDLELFARKYYERDREFYSQSISTGEPRFPGGSIADRFMFVCHGMGHKWLYESDSLCLLLHEIGFANAEQKAFRESAIPEVDQLDNRPEISLFVEARKDSAIGGLTRTNGRKLVIPWRSSLMIKLHFLAHVAKSNAGKSKRIFMSKFLERASRRGEV